MKRIIILIAFAMLPLQSFAGGWVEGVPVLVQKSDYSNLHLIYIQMQQPVTTTAQCSSTAGIIFEDVNESSTQALAMAMTALASGMKFRCYVNADRCSQYTGAATTFPVCDYYPGLIK